jgi:protein-disulfide isomerase
VTSAAEAEASNPRPRGPGWISLLGAALAGALVAAAAMWLFSGPIVRSAVLNDPEMISEGFQRLQDRQLAKIVSANRAAFETPFAGAWAGARNGDVVLVEFFDYACPYCRKSNADVARLVKDDPKLKLVWREWPVLGPDSQSAAEISLAAARKGRFRQFHDALFALGRPNPQAIAAARKAAGLGDADVAAVGKAEAGAELSKNYELARGLAASGTPTFVIGDRVLQGAVGYEVLKQAVKDARDR